MIFRGIIKQPSYVYKCRAAEMERQSKNTKTWWTHVFHRDFRCSQANMHTRQLHYHELPDMWRCCYRGHLKHRPALEQTQKKLCDVLDDAMMLHVFCAFQLPRLRWRTLRDNFGELYAYFRENSDLDHSLSPCSRQDSRTSIHSLRCCMCRHSRTGWMSTNLF